MPLPRQLLAALFAMSVGCTVVHGQPAARSDQPVAHDILVPGPVQSCPAAEVDPPRDPVTTSSLAGGGKFLARQHFREDISSRSAVKIAWLGAAFKQRLVSKIEEAVARATLQAFHVRRPARVAEIAAELGGRETTLGEFWCLLALQPNGESGLLFTTAVPNLFFIRDGGGVLWTVDALWGGAGWEIGASSIDGDRLWPAGVQAIVH